MLASQLPILIFLMTALAVGGTTWALFQPRLDREIRARDRLGAVVKGRNPTLPGSSKDRTRKQSVEDALRELAQKESGIDGKRRKVSLQMRLRQAGLGWSRRKFYLFGVISGLIGYLIFALAVRLDPLPSIGFGLAAALLVPNMYVSQKRKNRMTRFVTELPDSIDVIVRGVQSGLPLSDCLKAIGREAKEPVRAEFKAMVDDHTMGMSLSDAAARLPGRMPVPEATFFATVIAIQSRSGGSLSEALGNLSKVVRERKKMKNKIQAMSSEAKASAGIIGALPLFVIGVLSISSPEYVALLFTEFVGNIILAISAFWMLIGILVMRKMIAFDF